MSENKFDAILVVSFGGPEAMEDVMPFLENVLRGKNVPRERMLEVSEHYKHFDGVSPINQQNRELIAALNKTLGMNVEPVFDPPRVGDIRDSMADKSRFEQRLVFFLDNLNIDERKTFFAEINRNAASNGG